MAVFTGLGSAAAPSITFSADTDTGVFSPGANTLALATAGTNRLHITSAGLVGVGTSSPEQQLTVLNNSTAVASGSTLTVCGGTFNTGGEGGSIAFSNTVKAGITHAARIRSALRFLDVQEQGNLCFDTNNTSGLTERMRITYDGLVGIGTNNPQTALAISDPGSGIGFVNAAGGNFNSGLLGGISSVDAYVYQRANGPIIIATNNSERLRITAVGNVGIGTSAPAELLNVNGNIALDTAVLNTPKFLQFRANSDGTGTHSYGGITWYNFQWDNTKRAEISSGPDTVVSAGYLAFSTGNVGVSERMRISYTGNVGIGVASPSSLLHLADAGDITVGTTTGTKIGTASSQKLGFFNKTPVVQPTAVADATDAASVIARLNDLLARMRNLGLIAT